MFGERLKELRKNKKLTQEDIAKIFNINPATVSAWEVGKAQPNYDILVELANYFGVSIDFLLGNETNSPNTIDKVNQALREAGLVNSDETLKEEEIKLALDQARQYKILMTKLLDTPTKYQENAVKIEQNKNTNE
jgi:transcriptional regulator with XRE-family HTH domain